jgi:uncharacterized membrane protein HdeD (DUF308 family)
MPEPVTSNTFESAFRKRLSSIHPARGIAVAGGALSLLGILAIVTPFAFGVAMTFIVAVLLVIGSIALIALAVGGDHTLGQRILGIVGAVALFLGGIGMMFAPGLGLYSLTAGVAAYFFMSGFSRIMAAFLMPKGTSRGGVGLSGVLGVILGFVVYRQWAEGQLWVLGVLVGVDLMFYGFSLLASSWRIRHIERTITSVAS